MVGKQKSLCFLSWPRTRGDEAGSSSCSHVIAEINQMRCLALLALLTDAGWRGTRGDCHSSLDRAPASGFTFTGFYSVSPNASGFAYFAVTRDTINHLSPL